MFKSFNAYTGFTITVPDSITTLEFEEGFVIPSDVTFNSTHIDFSPYYAS